MKRILALLVAFLAAFAAVLPSASAADAQPAVMLVIDTSGSMQGESINAAKTAARKSVANLPDEVSIGLAQFDSNVRTLVQPTTDRTELNQAIDSLTAQGSTALYDSIVTTTSRVATGTVLIVLSDGADTVSKAHMQDSIAASNRAGVPVNIVGLNLNPGEKAVVRHIADRTGGTVVSANDVGSLAPVFEDIVQALAPVQPTVAAPTVADHARAAFIFGAFMFAALFLFFAAFAYWRSRRKEATRRQEVLAEYGLSDSVLARKPMSLPQRPQRFPGIGLKLERAGISISAPKWLALWAGAGALTALLVFALTGSAVLGLVMLPIVGALVPRLLVKSRAARRVASFGEDLPVFFREIASALRSGLSFSQALESVAGDGDSELRRQIRRALAEIRMGATTDSALMRVADRMDSGDMRWAVTALTIQREVGGNLAEILDTAAKTINERAQISREVKTLSAEGRLSAVILILLPIGLFVFLFATRREYIQIFWTTPIGWLMLTAIALLVSVGWVWMTKMMKIEV